MGIFKRLLALCLVLLMCVSMLSVIACNNKGGDTNTNTNTDSSTSTDTSTGTTNNPDGKVDYIIRTKTAGGMSLPNVTLAIYSGEDMKEFGTTDEDGLLTVKLPRGNYTAKIRDVAKGYKYNENGYTLYEAGTVITLSSSLISGSYSPTKRLELGDVMTDFSVTDAVTKQTVTLSGLFNGPDGIAGTDDDKKMVLINFFFTTCGPCVNEIPYMMAAYEEYKDDVAIIALNPYPTDDELAVSLFAQASVGTSREGYEPLTFTAAKVPTSWAMAIADASGTTSYPTNIIIDRYGVVTLVEVGGITSQTPFNLMFDFFSKDDYVQTLVTEMDQIMPVETPNVSMPSNDEIKDAINSGDIQIEYYGEDDEMAWPFIIKEDENGNKYITTSNTSATGSPKINSYSQINATVTLEAGQAIAFDYFANILGDDVVYVFVEGKDIFTISGRSRDWEKCYAYVAHEAGTYDISLIYLKDDSDDGVLNDGINIDNFRVVDATEIDVETYISYYAATKPNDKGEFTKYAQIVLGDDGFYHVGTKDGPYLLADLIGSTQFSNIFSVSILIYGAQGYELTTFSNQELLRLEDYANYASNSSFYGLCPVTEELKAMLVKIADEFGNSNNENEWLEFCEYFGAYGTTKQIENPIKGLADFCAFDAVERTEENPDAINYVVYDRGQIMPRGLLYKFVPTKSGAYRITSNSKEDVNGWIFLDAKKTLYQDGDMGERLAYLYTNNDPGNCTMVAYFEEGKAYYIDIAFYEVTMTGSFTFTVDYIAPEFNYFVVASPGPFTFDMGDDIDATGDVDIDSSNGYIAGGVDVILGSDGYYYVFGTHVTLEDALKQANSPENAYLCTDKNCQQCKVLARNYYAQLTLKTIRNLYERYNEDTSVTTFNVAFRDDAALERALDCICNYITSAQDTADMETRAMAIATTFANFISTRMNVTNYLNSLVDLINAIVVEDDEREAGVVLTAADVEAAFEKFEAELKTYDDFYHSIGSNLYADFLFSTSIFEKNIKQLINANALDFSKTADDQQVLAWISGFEVQYILDNLSAELKGELTQDDLVKIINGKKQSTDTALLEKIEELRGIYKSDKQNARNYFVKLWADEYAQNMELYQVEDVLNGIYHGAKLPSENDNYILSKVAEFKLAYGDNWVKGFVDMWGVDFATNYDEVYKVDEVLAGVYHGEGLNLTELILPYLDKQIDETTHPDNPELHGCVIVDKELAFILQAIMDKFTFSGVDHSWTKLCYYYITLKA